jgi:hypothetical protein
MILSLESLFDHPEETAELWKAHWKETEEFYRLAPLNPDWGQFHRLEQVKWNRYFTLRDGNVLVGHLYFIISPNRHTSTLMAAEDFFYLMPEYRKGSNALKLLRFAIVELQKEGIREILMSTKVIGVKSIEPLLKRVGFMHIANVYALGD